jgi:hypothetical protein
MPLGFHILGQGFSSDRGDFWFPAYRCKETGRPVLPDVTPAERTYPATVDWRPARPTARAPASTRMRMVPCRSGTRSPGRCTSAAGR